MEGRRISVGPRPCSGWRILARKGLRADGFVNRVKKLHRREISCKGDGAFSLSNAQGIWNQEKRPREYVGDELWWGETLVT